MSIASFFVGPCLVDMQSCGWIASTQKSVGYKGSQVPFSDRALSNHGHSHFHSTRQLASRFVICRHRSRGSNYHWHIRPVCAFNFPRTAPTRTLHPFSISTTTDADFFGVTPLRATRDSQHNSHLSLAGDIPPPPYADAELLAYSVVPNTEPITLAMYLFKFGFRTCHHRRSQ